MWGTRPLVNCEASQQPRARCPRHTKAKALGLHGDCGHHSSADLLFAMGEEKVCAAVGAEVERRDVCFGNSGVAQLVAVGLYEVEVAGECRLSVSGRALIEKQHRIARVE